MNQFDQAYLEAAKSLLEATKTHEAKVFTRASIDFIASRLALSNPPEDISKIMDDLYESYLYFLEAGKAREPSLDHSPQPHPQSQDPLTQDS